MEAKEGDTVILFSNHEDFITICLKKGDVSYTRKGTFKHDNVIGQLYGQRIYDQRHPRQSAVILKLTPEFRTESLSHRTQVVYAPDLAMISMCLGTTAGKIIVESGTGSASATLAFARNVGPSGHVYTFENNPSRHVQASHELNALNVSNVTCLLADVYKDGFTFEGSPLRPHTADGVFLDLPQPWNALKHADAVLKASGNLVVFSPCHEQLTETTSALKQLGYYDISCHEIILKPWSVFTESDSNRKAYRTKKIQGRLDELDNESEVSLPFHVVRDVLYALPTKGHTGYILTGTKPPTDGDAVQYDVAESLSRFRPHRTVHSPKKRSLDVSNE